MEFNTIVVGYDGSKNAQRAVDAAIGLVGSTGTIHLVTAYDAPSVRRINEAYATVPAEFHGHIDLLAEPRGHLSDASKYVADKGVEASEHFVDDDPASAILGVAKTTDADLIVVGSRGLGRASQVLRGSVSTKIAHSADVNFLVIH